MITSFFKVKALNDAILLNDSFGTNCEDGNSNESLFSRRQNEYLWCIMENAFHSAVEKLHLLVEDEESLATLCSWENYPKLMASSKVCVSVKSGISAPGQNKVLYSDLFRLANESGTSKLNQQHITPALIMNSDIYLSRDFTGLTGKMQDFLTRGGAFALTRWEEDGSCPLIENYQGSHDGFLFLPNGYTFSKAGYRQSQPANPAVDTVLEPENFQKFLRNVNLPQNTYQGENIIIFELMQALGEDFLRNPCLDLKLCHKHQVAFRQWLLNKNSSTAKKPDRYKLCQPCRM